MNQFILTMVGFLSLTRSALAEAAPVAEGGGMSNAMSQGLMLGAFALIFYFLIFRPQSKRAKEHRSLIISLQKGDEVITSGGLLGKIIRITDNFFVIIISEGIEVAIQKNAIAATLPKGTMKEI